MSIQQEACAGSRPSTQQLPKQLASGASAPSLHASTPSFHCRSFSSDAEHVSSPAKQAPAVLLAVHTPAGVSGNARTASQPSRMQQARGGSRAPHGKLQSSRSCTSKPAFMTYGLSKSLSKSLSKLSTEGSLAAAKLQHSTAKLHGMHSHTPDKRVDLTRSRSSSLNTAVAGLKAPTHLPASKSCSQIASKPASRTCSARSSICGHSMSPPQSPVVSARSSNTSIQRLHASSVASAAIKACVAAAVIPTAPDFSKGQEPLKTRSTGPNDSNTGLVPTTASVAMPPPAPLQQVHSALSADYEERRALAELLAATKAELLKRQTEHSNEVMQLQHRAQLTEEQLHEARQHAAVVETILSLQQTGAGTAAIQPCEVVINHLFEGTECAAISHRPLVDPQAVFDPKPERNAERLMVANQLYDGSMEPGSQHELLCCSDADSSMACSGMTLPLLATNQLFDGDDDMEHHGTAVPASITKAAAVHVVGGSTALQQPMYQPQVQDVGLGLLANSTAAQLSAPAPIAALHEGHCMGNPSGCSAESLAVHAFKSMGCSSQAAVNKVECIRFSSQAAVHEAECIGCSTQAAVQELEVEMHVGRQHAPDTPAKLPHRSFLARDYDCSTPHSPQQIQAATMRVETTVKSEGSLHLEGRRQGHDVVDEGHDQHFNSHDGPLQCHYDSLAVSLTEGGSQLEAQLDVHVELLQPATSPSTLPAFTTWENGVWQPTCNLDRHSVMLHADMSPRCMTSPMLPAAQPRLQAHPPATAAAAATATAGAAGAAAAAATAAITAAATTTTAATTAARAAARAAGGIESMQGAACGIARPPAMGDCRQSSTSLHMADSTSSVTPVAGSCHAAVVTAIQNNEAVSAATQNSAAVLTAPQRNAAVPTAAQGSTALEAIEHSTADKASQNSTATVARQNAVTFVEAGEDGGTACGFDVEPLTPCTSMEIRVISSPSGGFRILSREVPHGSTFGALQRLRAARDSLAEVVSAYQKAVERSITHKSVPHSVCDAGRADTLSNSGRRRQQVGEEDSGGKKVQRGREGPGGREGETRRMKEEGGMQKDLLGAMDDSWMATPVPVIKGRTQQSATENQTHICGRKATARVEGFETAWQSSWFGIKL